MGVEVLDSSMDFDGDDMADAVEARGNKPMDIDARRRLEDRLEEMRLRREMREFDFDL